MTRTLTILMSLMLMAAVAAAQMPSGTAGTQDMRSMMEQTIAGYHGLDGSQRDRMRSNLDQCLSRGMPMPQIHTLFPSAALDPRQAEGLLTLQEKVLAAAERDLPTGPMIDKIAEGRMKGIPDGRLAQVLDQVEMNLDTAHRHVMQAMNHGISPSGGSMPMEQATSELARCLWDGLGEQDLQRMEEHARMRSRNGECTLDDFVAANQAATRFMAGGMDHERAMNMAGDALMHGYSPDQMRTMGMMAMGGDQDADRHHEMMANMQNWVHEGMSWDEMTEHMTEGGWMGPADMMGPGGSNPVDNMGMSGPGHDGGMMGGDHDHDGMGGGDGGMGGGDGHGGH